MGIGEVTVVALRACSVASMEFGSRQMWNSPAAFVVSRSTCGVWRMPASFETSISIHVIETSAPATGLRVYGSLTWPITAEPARSTNGGGHLWLMSVAAGGTDNTTRLVLSGPTRNGWLATA